MRTIRKLLHAEILIAVAFATLAFLSLFFFFDLVEEMQAVTRHDGTGYTLTQALGYVALIAPTHLYELLPITVLIGTIFVMARLAQSSEYVILRTSGLGPWRALGTLLSLGLVFVVLTFVLGDYVAPSASRAAELLKAQYTGHITVGHTGAWLKEKQPGRQFMVNVGELAADGSLRGVRLFEFDDAGILVATTQADRAVLEEVGAWRLYAVQRTVFPHPADADGAVVRESQAELRWANHLGVETISAALLRPGRMRTVDLYGYIAHLHSNRQAAQRYEIEFWRKVFYPLSCLVMVVLALPFAYLHFRSNRIATYVFAGVLAGISFFLLNNVMGYVGNLRHWAPWFAAALPGMVYSALSLGAFGWLVVRR
ncbi:LPS export ABC transporter permease LptG [Candidatus Symbiobacter mobilis]|uniref:Lipopolysaccharide export system permease protein n=1 Tax=Candidatus Symbiobacter mobilis CR TaxID=946483 RepID=U5ND46_9BURK|nr:LPS export ABC transporter permease LptG [Candidatus Symbiobacter mobilis]AGX88094.1 lipopolysaccharide export system permease protein [Candidatus Symbiobacter mobilis CR]